MATVMIKEKEYKELLDKKLRLEYLRHMLEADIFVPPPIRKSKDVVAAFKATKLYNKQFLTSLQRGLKRSSYFMS